MEILEEKVYCKLCNRKTNHDILMTHFEKNNPYEEFQWHCKYHITKCRGCDTPAFVMQYGDEDQWDYNDEGKRYWYYIFTVYPPEPKDDSDEEFRKNIYSIEHINYNNVPETINNIYKQIIDVYNQGALLLGTVGIRTIIEAICLDVGIENG
ncbi:hypothetical protein ACQKCU_15095 [Heyndrickxia sporothermodurans]